MQGRASKTPKKELVIESPQQYKSLAAAEAEVEAVPQVVVSHTSDGWMAWDPLNEIYDK